MSAKKKQSLTVRLFGPVSVSANGSDIAISGKKPLALLLYLCRREGTAVPRETICDLLWPDSADDQARGSLRQTLSMLRKSLDQGEVSFVWASKSAVSMRGDNLFIDANAFESETGNTADESIALYRGDLAEGLSGVSPEFDRWLETERRVMRTRLLDYLGKALAAQRQNSEFEDALATAARMIEIDPLQEHIHRSAMEILAAQGNLMQHCGNSHNKPEDLKTYELVMRGTEQMHRYDEVGFTSAIDSFREAIKRDAGYGRAHGLCAQALAYHIWLYLLDDDVDEPMSLAKKPPRLIQWILKHNVH